MKKNVQQQSKKIIGVDKKQNDLQEDVGKIESHVKKQRRTITVVEKDVKKISKHIQKEKGLENFMKGTKYQEGISAKVKKALGKQGIFQRYQAIGRIGTAQITSQTAKKSHEIDLYETLQDIQTKKEVILVVETKNRKSKVSRTDVEKFMSLLQLVSQHNKGKKLFPIYLDHHGNFSQPAIEILTKNKIVFGTLHNIIQG